MRSIALRVILFWMAVAGCREPNVQPIDSTRPQSLDIQPASATLWAGETQKFTATVRDVGGRTISDAMVSWRATNSAVLFVNDSGLVRGLASAADASATVIASYADLADTAVVTVKVKVTEVFNVWPDTNALIVGMTRKLVSRIIKPGVYYATIDRIPIDASSWTSSDTSVAKVTADGTVTAVRVGQTIVTAVLWDGRLSRATIFVLPATPLRFSSLYSTAAFGPGDDPPGTAGCGLNAADGGMYCWGEFGMLWGETVVNRGYSSRMLLPASYVQAFDRCEHYVRYGSGMLVWLDHARCSEVPVRFFATSSFTTLANWNCGLSAANESFCWGDNANGQLGIGTTDTLQHGLTAVATTERFQSLSTERCGLRGDGVAFCWGGAYGPTPTRMAGNVTWRRFATRGPCGLAVDSTAYCWSGNTAPVQVGAGMKFIDIAVANIGGRCALTDAGRAYCWRGDMPVLVAGDPPLVSLAVISVGPNSLGTGVCGLSAAGDLYCVAEAGPSATRTFSLQRRDLGGRKFRSVSGNCGIALDDKVYCWTWGNVVTVVPGQ